MSHEFHSMLGPFQLTLFLFDLDSIGFVGNLFFFLLIDHCLCNTKCHLTQLLFHTTINAHTHTQYDLHFKMMKNKVKLI